MGKFVLNSAGVRDLLKSSGVQARCIAEAHKLASRDSGDHSINSRVGKNRCNAEIVFTGNHAKERRDSLL